MNVAIIDERSIDLDRLTPEGWVLDVGARGYVFATEMARRGMQVVAMDPEPPPPGFLVRGVTPVVRGLVGIGYAGMYQFASWDNGEGDHLVGFGGGRPPGAAIREAEANDITQVMRFFHVERFDCVKLNCEGAEYNILKTWPGPIARQISVSFHDHTGANRGGEETYRVLFAHLGQWYDMVRHVWEDRYCAGHSYWDTLMVLKEGL